ncbi:transposase [Streptomyces sp. NPDC007100]|uniref:transposase n=1 Tax=Streptomyces sp. NPDC007100 TaxID=3155602 RepID=UPI0033DFA2A1
MSCSACARASSRTTVGDNPERSGTEASFAALCGVSPIEYSSGRRTTRRLNQGGDRQANAPCTDRVHPAAPRPAHPGVIKTPHSGGRSPS